MPIDRAPLPGPAQSARDVALFPFNTPSRFKTVRWGGFDAAGQPLPLGPILISSWVFRPIAWRKPPQPAESLPVLPGRHLFLGAVFGHFGHFIAETLPQLIVLRALLDAGPDLMLLGLVNPGGSAEDLGMLRQFCRLLGIDAARIRLLDKPARVEQLVWPASPFAGRFAYARSLPAAIDALPQFQTEPSGERLFLSRRRMPNYGSRVPNIAEIEDLYQARGFTILCPETLDLEQQIRRVTAAREIAGENGSALHWSLYSPAIRRVTSLGWPLPLQKGICAVRGQGYQTIPGRLQGLLQGRHRPVSRKAVVRALAKA